MRFGCRECVLGPCYIEKEYLEFCIDINGDIKENINEFIIITPKDLNTMPVECIPMLNNQLKLIAKKLYFKPTIEDGSIV